MLIVSISVVALTVLPRLWCKGVMPFTKGDLVVCKVPEGPLLNTRDVYLVQYATEPNSVGYQELGVMAPNGGCWRGGGWQFELAASAPEPESADLEEGDPVLDFLLADET